MCEIPTNRFILSQLGVSNLADARAALYGEMEGHEPKRNRLLDGLLTHGDISDGFKPVLARLLSCRTEELERAIQQNRHLKARQAWVARFRELGPHFHIETASTPRPVFAAAMTCRQFKVKPVPAVAELDSLEEKLQYGIAWAQDHAPELPGELPVFGEITGLTFYPDQDSAFSFDREGHYLGVSTKRGPWQPAFIRL